MKEEDVRKYIACGDLKNALRGAKDFRIGITKEQRSVMARAYECMVHPDFYRNIGKNLTECIEAGKSVLAQVV